MPLLGASFFFTLNPLNMVFRKVLVFFFLFFCLFSVYAQQKPNIIYIYADDLGYGELGCYGQEKIKTPNLDKLAASGMRFTQHYTGAPVCAPARSILMTGKHSGHSYIRGNYELGQFDDANEGGQMPLHEGAFTVAKLMKMAGYVTGAIGKWGLGMANTTGDPNKHGFDYFYGYLDQKQAHNLYPTHLWENGKWDTLGNRSFFVHQKIPENAADSVFNSFIGKDYALAKMGDKTLEFLKRNKTKPFFLYLPYTSPHLALQAPVEAVNEYVGKFSEKPYYGEKGYAPTKYPLSTYAAMVTYLDKQVGRVMDMVKELGLEKNTIILFSSDNGPTFDVGGVNAKFFNSASGMRGLKQDLYEGGIREPFIVSWPGRIKAGTVSGHISAQYDLLATLADIVQIKAPATDGLSFLPTLTGKAQKPHEYLYFEFPEKSGQVAVRMGKWKGVKSNLKTNPKAPWEIFDLEYDPSESKDLAASHPELITQFDMIVKKEHSCSHIRDWEFIDPKFKVVKN
jgi:arylsulfatase A